MAIRPFGRPADSEEDLRHRRRKPSARPADPRKSRAAVGPLAGKVGAIEGRRHGDAIEIESDDGDNSSYVSTGYKSFVGGRTTVTIGLRGAKPSFKLVQKDKLANFIEQRFDGDTGSSLLDDEAKRAIIEYAVMVPMLEKIEVTEHGLAISFGAIEKRVAEEAHVRVDAYREPAPEEADAEEALERRA